MSEVITDPTHEKEGRTLHYCLDCDYEYYSDYVPPTGHLLKQEIHTPTCTEQGYTYNYCHCGYHYNSNYVPPLGHTLSVEETKPTCDTEGYKAAHCSVCGYHYTYDVVSPLGHDMSIQRFYPSLDNEKGYSVYDCGTCGMHYIGDEVFYHDIYKGAFVENTSVLAKGIDVSYYNHESYQENGITKYKPLDWVKIKEQGYDFAILRIGYMGSRNVGVTDPVFEMNYRDAKAAGLGVGAYIYSYAYSISDAKAEAQFVLEAIKDKQFEYPIYFDVEDENILEKVVNNENAADTLTDICSEFIGILQNNGYFAALYTSNDWLTNYFETDKVLTLFDVWYARYPYISNVIMKNDAVWSSEYFNGRQIACWQFSKTGGIEGVSKISEKTDGEGNAYLEATPKFDLNYVYKDYPSIMKKYGLNGFPPEKDTTNLDGQHSSGETGA